MVKSLDQQIYQRLTHNDDVSQSNPSQYGSAFITHVVVKVIPLALLILDGFITTIFSQVIVNEFVVIFTVIDFWVTKNITGRRMIGIRWFFSDDQYGIERFQYECRANGQKTSKTSSRLFWLVQFIYCVVPIFTIGVEFFIQSNSRLRTIALGAFVLGGGLSNLFFFYKASQGSAEKQEKLKREVGEDVVRKMGLATIISH